MLATKVHHSLCSAACRQQTNLDMLQRRLHELRVSTSLTMSYDMLLVMLFHHLELGLGAILLSHSTCLPGWHSLGVSALLLVLANGLFHKGGLSGFCPWVVKALLALKVGKVGLGSWHWVLLLLLLVLARVGITID